MNKEHKAFKKTMKARARRKKYERKKLETFLKDAPRKRLMRKVDKFNRKYRPEQKEAPSKVEQVVPTKVMPIINKLGK